MKASKVRKIGAMVFLRLQCISTLSSALPSIFTFEFCAMLENVGAVSLILFFYRYRSM